MGFGSDKKGRSIEVSSKRAKEHTGFKSSSSSSKTSSNITKIQKNTFNKVSNNLKGK